MKRLLFPALIFCISTSAFSQVKKDSVTKTNPPKISVDTSITDSTGLISIKDVQELEQQLQELPAKFCNPISGWLNQRLQLRAQEWLGKKKK